MTRQCLDQKVENKTKTMLLHVYKHLVDLVFLSLECHKKWTLFPRQVEDVMTGFGHGLTLQEHLQGKKMFPSQTYQ